VTSAADRAKVLADLDPLIDELAGQLCNWGRWGDDDELGTLNLITAEKRVEASACVKEGAVFSLGFELRPDMPQPPGSGRLNPQHYMTETAVDTAGAINMTAGADDVLVMAVHGGTHWDALSHIFHRDKMYGGSSASLVNASAGARRNDIVSVARQMVTRGVLADVAGYHGVDVLPVDHAVTADELQNVVDAQRVEIRPGDALLVRTGLVGKTRQSGDWSSFTAVGTTVPAAPGIDIGCLPWISEHGICALACDNWAVEKLAGGDMRFPLHEVSIVYMGMILGETFELDALASACALDRRYDFLLSAAPLPIRSGVGGPVNPMVLR
jgi:kynurenine formamidase